MTVVMGPRLPGTSPSVDARLILGGEMNDVVLPAFEMDCRDWMVVSPGDVGLPEDAAGSPLLAVLSTMVVEDDIREATGALTVGMIEDDEPLETRAVAGSIARELLDDLPEPGTRRYLMPAPGQRGQRIALLAEFVVENDREAELDQRVERLMASFRWQPEPSV